jgi:hypothetical protein
VVLYLNNAKANSLMTPKVKKANNEKLKTPNAQWIRHKQELQGEWPLLTTQ